MVGVLRIVKRIQMVSSIKIYPVVLIGGSGTRLWPMSRVNFPKQFNRFNRTYSLFQNTLLRLKGIKNLALIYLVVNESNYFICLDQLRELDIKNVEILVEPIGRNTASAIAIAANIILKKHGDDSLMLVLASDHQINDNKKFVETINTASQFTKNEIILFGVKPTKASTAYGYIESANTAFPAKVKRFLEKPDLEVAQNLIKNTHIFWNSGIFLFSVKTILNEINIHATQIGVLSEIATKNTIIQGNTIYFQNEFFSALPDIPIDIAVIEKTDNAYIFLLNSDWTDLGDWDAVYKSELPDQNGNVLNGSILSIDTKNCYLNSENKLLATIGIDNLIVVSAKDSILVANKNQAQEVKKLVSALKENIYAEYAENDLKVYRPWGSYENVVNLENFKVKHIIVKPGGKLSLQMHHHRSEHWVVVKGIADVVCEEKNFQVFENESTYVPRKVKHRLINSQDIPLHIIEIQVGSYLGEDDIVRFDDVYGRKLEPRFMENSCQ